MSKPYKFPIFVLDHVRHGCLRTRVPLPVGFFFHTFLRLLAQISQGKCVSPVIKVTLTEVIFLRN